MGVTGLWDILEAAGESRSLARLSVVEGFEGNTSRQRAYRLGIDASLWYQHATTIRDDGTKGANFHLRTLFFRLCRLTSYPILPLFVFDGQQRPKVKRGSRMGKSGSHNMTAKFKTMIDCFGWEWRTAQGEAEAELAYLNSINVIDAVVTDDVDALVFGAKTLLRNPGLGLSGNRNNPATNSAGKVSGRHQKIYTATKIQSHPTIRLSRNGMILIALLSGGDYDKGVKGIGITVAYALARLGYGDRLIAGYRRGAAHLQAILPQWRAELNHELHTNASKLLPSRLPSTNLDASFPDLGLLEGYLNPLCSAQTNLSGASLAMRDRGNLSLPRIAKFAEDHFDEWGHRSMIIYRFYNILYEGAVMHVLRRAALAADEKEGQHRAGQPFLTVGTPASLVQKCLDPPMKRGQDEDRLASAFSRHENYGQPAPRPNVAVAAAAIVPDTHPLIVQIEGVRCSVNTDNIPEYRVLVACKQLDDLTSKGIVGKHPEPGPTATQVKATAAENPVARREQMRIWVAQSIMRRVHPGVVAEYEKKVVEKGKKGKTGAGKGKGKRKAADADSEEEEEDSEDFDDDSAAPKSPTKPSPPKRARKNKATTTPVASSSRVTLDDPEPTSMIASQTQTPTNPIMYHNVGFILDENPVHPRAFRFTFSNPDDPDMLILDEDDIFNKEPLPAIPTPSTSSSARLSAIPPTRNARATSSSQQPTQRRKKATQPRKNDAIANDALALVEGLEAGSDEPVPRIFSQEQEDIIDRSLGIGPSVPKKRRSKPTAATQTAKRKRTTGATPLDINLRSTGAISLRRRKNAAEPALPVVASTSRPQPAPFPDIPLLDAGHLSSDDEELLNFGRKGTKNRTSYLNPAPGPFASSSQDSDLFDPIMDPPAGSSSGRPRVARPYGWRAGSAMPSSSQDAAFFSDVQYTIDLT